MIKPPDTTPTSPALVDALHHPHTLPFKRAFTMAHTRTEVNTNVYR